MEPLALHELHQQEKAAFIEVNGMEVVSHYGDLVEEYMALRESTAVLDLSFRSRLCLIGEDRQRFLHGQVTNNVLDLDPGDGCYAALVSAKGKMQSDLNVYALSQEILLDFEPGLFSAVSQRLKQYIIADDVQVVDVAEAYGMLSVQGPKAGAAVQAVGLELALPTRHLSFSPANDSRFGEIYCMNQPRGLTLGYDLFAPRESLAELLRQLKASAQAVGGRLCGWEALEAIRIEAGIPRFGMDMDETNLPPEAGIEKRAISYTKGCYIGQEVMARIRTYGHVARSLRGLRLKGGPTTLPGHGAQLMHEGKEVGYITSTVISPAMKGSIALGYVRREHNQIGTELKLVTSSGEFQAEIVPLPFVGN